MDNSGFKKESKVHKAVRILKEKGPIELGKKVQKKLAAPWKYHKWFMAQRVTPEELSAQAQTHFEYELKISILVPTYRTPLPLLREMIDSVRAQSYANWELCIADGSVGAKVNADGSVAAGKGQGENGEGNAQGSKAAGANVKSPLEDILAEYHEKDPRIVYRILDRNGGISYNTNRALDMATGEFIGLLDHDDVLEADALFEVVKALQNRETKIVYTDEDKATNNLKKFMDPNFKPDFSIDLFRSHNYITHFYVVSTEVLRAVGGEDSKHDGAQDYDMMFRCIEKVCTDFGRDKAREIIAHVPRVLYHWRLAKGSTAENPESKMYAYESGRSAVEDHLKRMGIPATVEMTEMWGMYHTIYEVSGKPLVSIIIPNKDHTDDLDNCIRSIIGKSVYKNIEFVIAENNSTEDETFAYYENIQKEFSNVKVVKWDREFNYAAINNFAAGYAKGEYCLFLNNDTEMISETAISEMLGICQRGDVGIVGAKLIYPDESVQHAGILLGFRGYAQHVFVGIGRNEFGFMVRARINCNYNAVTGACLMVSKEDFDAVKGFSEDFPVAGNDVDFCLKVRKLEKLVVYNAFSEWYHYESKSRGYEDSPEKAERFNREVAHFREIWGDRISRDEYYNANFDMENGPYEL
ncbi:MAG: glycosyltransferase [Lachnospiraceae bacterium]|nr:glycosyltransferase [Lachnospiraceae bacterium]